MHAAADSGGRTRRQPVRNRVSGYRLLAAPLPRHSGDGLRMRWQIEPGRIEILAQPIEQFGHWMFVNVKRVCARSAPLRPRTGQAATRIDWRFAAALSWTPHGCWRSGHGKLRSPSGAASNLVPGNCTLSRGVEPNHAARWAGKRPAVLQRLSRGQRPLSIGASHCDEAFRPANGQITHASSLSDFPLA